MGSQFEKSSEPRAQECLEILIFSPILDSNSTRLPSAHAPSTTSRTEMLEMCGVKAEEDNIAPSTDVQMLVDQIVTMSTQEAIDILLRAIAYHQSETIQTILP